MFLILVFYKFVNKHNSRWKLFFVIIFYFIICIINISIFVCLWSFSCSAFAPLLQLRLDLHLYIVVLTLHRILLLIFLLLLLFCLYHLILRAFLVFSISVSTFAFSSPLILSPNSSNVFSLLYIKLSALFLLQFLLFSFCLLQHVLLHL